VEELLVELLRHLFVVVVVVVVFGVLFVFGQKKNPTANTTEKLAAYVKAAHATHGTKGMHG
jgi:hypothetical protein